MELIKSYLVRISKNEEYNNNIRTTTNTNKITEDSDLTFYTQQGSVNLLLNANEKNKVTNVSISNSFNSDRKKKTYFKNILNRNNNEKSSSFQIRGNYLFKKREKMLDTHNNNRISTLYKAPVSKSPPLINKPSSQSQTSIISMSSLHINPPQDQSSIVSLPVP